MSFVKRVNEYEKMFIFRNASAQRRMAASSCCGTMNACEYLTEMTVIVKRTNLNSLALALLDLGGLCGVGRLRARMIR